MQRLVLHLQNCIVRSRHAALWSEVRSLDHVHADRTGSFNLLECLGVSFLRDFVGYLNVGEVLAQETHINIVKWKIGDLCELLKL